MSVEGGMAGFSAVDPHTCLQRASRKRKGATQGIMGARSLLMSKPRSSITVHFAVNRTGD